MIQLIPITYLKEECMLSENVDERKYSIVVKDAQMDLEDILGSEFYEEIESQYHGDSFTDDNDTLYEDYIKDYLAWQTFLHYLKFANVEATGSGFRTHNDENSTLVNDLQLMNLEKNVEAKAVRYRNRMMNFLKLEQSKDSAKYPLYDNACKEVHSFSITAIDKKSDALFNVNKTINTNE